MTITMLDNQIARATFVSLLAKVARATRASPSRRRASWWPFVALTEELDDLQAAQRAAAILTDLDAGRTDARPWAEIQAEWIAEGLLDG